MTDRRLLALAAFAVLTMCTVSGGPLLVRACFGVVSFRFTAETLAIIALLGLASAATMVLVFRALARRGSRLWVAAAIALVCAVPLLTALSVLELWVVRTWPGLLEVDPNEPRTVAYFVAVGLSDSLPVLVVFAGALFFPAAVQAEQERRDELKLVRREAEVLRLRSHLEPHFVLNTLNAISGLAQEDARLAQELVAALGDVFREATGFQERHPVRDELAWLERYLTIHRLRHGEGLSAECAVDPALETQQVPSLILQPLVENALVHGALKQPQGRVRVTGRREGAVLVFEVRDNGPALGAPRAGGKGVALVERRLALEGGRGASLTLRREGEETVATVRLEATA